MSDQVVELLQLQVQQLLIRVDVLEKKVGELERGRRHNEDFELVFAAPRASSPARTSSSAST